jgi:hypothetical protein
MPQETLPDKVRRAQDALGAKVYVLVWGPGKYTKEQHWYEKRLRVVDHLKGLNKNYEIWTSEDILSETDQTPLTDAENIEAGSREIVHASEADLIVALVLGPPDKQPGIYRELQLVSIKRELRNKTYIFLPDQPSYRRQFTSGVVKNFRDDHIFPLPWAVLKDCEQVRSRCGFLAEQELRQKLLDTMYSYI